MSVSRVDQIFAQALRAYRNRNYASSLSLLECLEALPDWDRAGAREQCNLAYARAWCLYRLGWLDSALDCCTRLTEAYADPRGAELAQRILGAESQSGHAA